MIAVVTGEPVVVDAVLGHVQSSASRGGRRRRGCKDEGEPDRRERREPGSTRGSVGQEASHWDLLF